MSERKTIQINPDLFNFSSNKTRKKNPQPTSSGNIKIRPERPRKRDDTLKKRSILRMIRQHQEEKYKKMFDESQNKRENKRGEISINTDFDSDFEQSKQYLNKLIEENEQKEKGFNRTLKHYPSQQSSLLYSQPFENITTHISTPITNVTPNFTHTNQPSSMYIQPRKTEMVLQQPQYGCLKNGNLPTYRNWINKTQKNTPQYMNRISDTINSSTNNGQPNHMIAESSKTTPIHSEIVDSRVNDNINKMNEMKQMMMKLQGGKDVIKQNKMKQKRTIRRTYKIGKSKIYPQISVLVSNKTIRNNISTKKQLLKQVQMQDIKKYLITHGFIKVGSTAPNDILRKMYESAILMCGEVQNHNPDILLYNFMNEEK